MKEISCYETPSLVVDYKWNVSALPSGKCKSNFALFLFIFFLSPGKSVGVSSILLGLILVGRAAFVFPLSFLSNLTKNSPYEKVTLKQQV
jgi:hypothetical protein